MMLRTRLAGLAQPLQLWLAGGERQRLQAAAAGGIAWTLVGAAGQRVLRLASNLILTRLLFPEAFGTMVIVNAVLTGLETFADFGVKASIIQNRRGDDAVFLNTAWSLQIVRGFGLWVLACVLAWPTALLYDQPELMWLLPAAGASAAISGFNSTSLATLNRKLTLGRLTLLELWTQVVGTIATIACSLLWPSVWALLIGSIVTRAYWAWLSHELDPEFENQWAWDPGVIKEIVRFGRWLFVATALGFLADGGFELVLGKFLDARNLGVFYIAWQLVQTPSRLLTRVGARVLFPLYARLAEDGSSDLARQMMRIRLALLAVTLPIFWALAVAGPWFVSTLYDPRYAEAGWMVQVLAIGSACGAVTLTLSPVLIATGKSFSHCVVLVTRTLIMFTGMALGMSLGGVAGLLMGFSVTSFLNYPVVAWQASRQRAWTPQLDVPCLAISATFAALIFPRVASSH